MTIISTLSRIKEAFKNGDYASIGGVIAQGFNAAIDKLHSVFTEFDWPGLAAGLAQYLNGIVSGIDWGKLGTTLSTGLSRAIATLRSAITTFDWASLGKGIADAIDNIDWVGLLSDLAGSISDILKAALDLLIGFAENLDWGKLGRDLWNGLIGIITNIDWGGIISKAFRLLGAALGGCVSLIVEFCKELWESLKAGFESTKSYFNKYIEEAGGNVVQGIWNGIVNALKNVGNWIVENIWNPFIEGFKNAFGIHSPSTKMAEMGGYIIQGLCNGIKNAWSSITGFFSGALENIKTTLSNAWENVKTTASTKWENIKTAISTAWGSVKTTANNVWDGIKTTLSNKWENIKTNASTAWKNLKTTISTGWENIKKNASTTWDGIKDTIKNKGWSGIGSNICEGIKTGINSGWQALKTKVGEVAKSLLDKAKSALGIHSPSRLFRDIVGLNIGYGIGEGIVDSEKSVVGKVSDLAGAIAAECNAGTYTLGADVETAHINNAMGNFSNIITDGFSTLLDRLQAIANGVNFNIPVIATGTILPKTVTPNGNIGSNFNTAFDASTERLSEDLSSVIIQSVNNAAVAIVNAIEEYSGPPNICIDERYMTNAVVKEINKRAIMTGKNPLLGTKPLHMNLF